MGSKSNNLNSHHGESINSRADKMSGYIRELKKKVENFNGKRYASQIKKFYNKKRRMFLKNPENYDKI
jgi:hypothetical protein